MLGAKSADLVVRIKTDTSQAKTDIDQTAGAFSKMGATLSSAFNPAVVLAGVAAIGAGMVKVTFMASDLNETISASEVIFGGAAQAIKDFAADSARSLGMTKVEAIGAANTFATFGKSAGLAGSDLVNFSTDMVSLATDLASFKNTSPEEAIQAIGSALRGEAEPIRAYGILLDDATLRQEALALGIITTTKEALTPQQKVLAAQSAIMKQSTDAQGDFERTSGSLANQMKILTAQVEDWATALGVLLLPAAQEVVKFVNESIIPAFSNLGASSNSQWVTDLIATLTELKDAVLPPLALALGELVKWLKEFATWISQNEEALKVLKVAVIAIAVALALLIAAFVAVIVAVGLVAAAMIAVSGGAIFILIKAFEAVRTAVGFVISKITEMKDFIDQKLSELARLGTGLWDWLWKGIEDAINTVKRKLGELVDWVKSIPRQIEDALRGIWDKVPKPPSWFPGTQALMVPIPALAGGGIVTRPTLALLGERGREAVVPLGASIGRSIVINIQHSGLAVDSPRLQRDIVEALNRYEGRNGRRT